MSWLTRRLLMSAAPPYVGPLDLLATKPLAAYSLRRLTGAYFGPAIRVLRSGDNTLADIGFTATGDLNVTALLAFVGIRNGYVTTWYDQSGNGLNASQASHDHYMTVVSAGALNLAAAGSTRPGILAVSTASTTQMLLANQREFTVVLPITRISVTRIPSTAPSTSFSLLCGSTNGGILSLKVVGATYQIYDYNQYVTASDTFTADILNTVTEVYNAASSSITVNGITTTGSLKNADSGMLLEVGALSRVENASVTHCELLQFSGLVPLVDQTLLRASQQDYWGTP